MRLCPIVAFGALALGLQACGPSNNTAPPPAAADASPATTRFFPCDVEAVIKAKCQTCHTIPRVMDAPFPLLEYADTQADYSAGQKVWQAMKTAIEIDFMPLAGSPTGPLTPQQKTTMLIWLGAGAPAALQRCPTSGR